MQIPIDFFQQTLSIFYSLKPAFFSSDAYFSHKAGKTPMKCAWLAFSINSVE